MLSGGQFNGPTEFIHPLHHVFPDQFAFGHADDRTHSVQIGAFGCFEVVSLFIKLQDSASVKLELAPNHERNRFGPCW